MDHVEFVVGSYVITAVAIAAYIRWIFRHARKLDALATEEDKPWT